MNTQDLKCFETVYKEKSLTRAAGILFISPQGLGKIIRRLEQEFDTTFFERTNHGLILPPSAHIFHKHQKPLLQQLELLVTSIEELKVPANRLHIGFSNGVLRAFPLQLIFSFMERFPELSISWSEYENSILLEKIRSNEIDLGFCIGSVSDPACHQQLLSQIPIVALVYQGHPLYEHKTITIPLLKGEKILSMNEQHHIYHDLIAACKLHGFTPDFFVKTSDGGTLESLCSQGLGIGIVPAFSNDWHSNIHAIPFENSPTWDIFLTRKDPSSFELLLQFEEHILISNDPDNCRDTDKKHR